MLSCAPEGSDILVQETSNERMSSEMDKLNFDVNLEIEKHKRQVQEMLNRSKQSSSRSLQNESITFRGQDSQKGRF